MNLDLTPEQERQIEEAAQALSIEEEEFVIRAIREKLRKTVTKIDGQDVEPSHPDDISPDDL
jgi:uncharacterized protein (DUF1778 family)